MMAMRFAAIFTCGRRGGHLCAEHVVEGVTLVPPEPLPYVVYWLDGAEQERLAREQGCGPADVELLEYTRMREFASLPAARRFAGTVHGQIERRVGVRFDRRSWEWEWDQEPAE